jgi:hypothetical protein
VSSLDNKRAPQLAKICAIKHSIRSGLLFSFPELPKAAKNEKRQEFGVSARLTDHGATGPGSLLQGSGSGRDVLGPRRGNVRGGERNPMGWSPVNLMSSSMRSSSTSRTVAFFTRSLASSGESGVQNRI